MKRTVEHLNFTR